jgi:hypothetical protein
MAQKFVSPGVFTTEVDQSFLAQGVAGIGGMLVGRTLKGPAFVPIFSQGFDQFVSRFGQTDPKYQLPYCVKNYLKNSGAVTTVRVLGHADGTAATNGYTVGAILGVIDKASTGQIFAEIHLDNGLSASNVRLSGTTSLNEFVFRILSGATNLFVATASFLTSSANYIGKVLNTDPTKNDTYYHYIYRVFGYAAPSASILSGGKSSWTFDRISGSLTNFTRDFEHGDTTWVKSQPLGGLEFDLFKFHTLGDGRATNDEIKVQIMNIKPSVSPLATPYGTFDIVVRQFSDTDQRQVVYETFTGCTLDPNSKAYVARKVGDVYETFDTTQRKFIANGTFPNKSRYIRIEMNTTANSPAEALPWGFGGYEKLEFTGGATVPSLPYTPVSKDRNGNIDANISWGVCFTSGSIADRMRARPDSASSYVENDADFSLSYLSSSYDVNGKRVWWYNTASTDYQPLYVSASLQKFTMPFYGGFDGWDLRVEDPLYLANNATDTNIGVVSLKRALDTIANPDAFDMNLLAIPGVHNLKVADYARTLVNDRADALYVMDVTGSSVAEVVGSLKDREIDDNYTACYYPDLKLNDKTSNRIVRISPSVAVMGAIAFSDRVGQVFFAPAGLNRGGLGQFDIIDVVDRLNFQDRNDLYDNRINPIATFPNEGIVVFGQKTLQVKSSALDRINVRRLLIFAKKTIASAAKYLLFEPNNPATWQRFSNLVNPILENIRQNQGIERFRVVMDSTTNTPDVVDRNIMSGKIFLQPTKSAEFIDLSFIITNAGVSFGE